MASLGRKDIYMHIWIDGTIHDGELVMNQEIIKPEEIGCWDCALEGIKSGKSLCPDCGTEIAHNCKKYRHEKIYVEKSEIKKEG